MILVNLVTVVLFAVTVLIVNLPYVVVLSWLKNSGGLVLTEFQGL